MQTKDQQLQSINICQKLFNFFVHNFFSRGLKRLTSGPPRSQPSSTNIPVDVHQPNPPLTNPDHDEIVRPNHDNFHVHFKHGEDDDQFESWTRLDHGETKDETNPGQVRGRKMVLIQDGKEEVKKGKKKSDKTTSSQGDKITLAIDPSDEPELDGLILRPHLISVASNINEKSDEFIKTRMAAMQDLSSTAEKH